MQLIGIDVGGTFTDFVWLVDGRLRVQKVSTTPVDQSRAMREGLDALGVAPDAAIVHGTTVATNALLEHRGAKAALITTAGFEDVLAIGRQNRPHLYRLSQERPPVLVPPALRRSVRERVTADGTVLTPLDEEQAGELAAELDAAGAESVAVVLLFGYENPVHERRVAELLRARRPDWPISLGSDLLPEYREYERTATTVVNAYVQPLVARYLGRLREVLGERSIQVMQSNGGPIGIDQAAAQAARLVLSGPAGGVVGAFELAKQALGTDTPRLMTFDMGGTSTDVALCPGTIPHTTEGTIAGLPLRLPSTDIHTVGAGGGSIARVDSGGVLRVGPASAGADPGPVCYGRGGTAPTVTDANLVLGRLDAGQFLGGSGAVALDAEAARAVLGRLGAPLGLTAEETALGVIEVANATMERALRRVSVEQGHDPREHALVPFGGAGPLHAFALAEALGVQTVLVPPNAGVLSALGLLLADRSTDASRSVLTPLDEVQAAPDAVRRLAAELGDHVRDVLVRDGAADPVVTAALDLRYAGQSYELTVPLALPVTEASLTRAAEAFHDAHHQRYGYADRSAVLEAVTLRAEARAPGARPTIEPRPRATTQAEVARIGERPVWFAASEPTPTTCYDRGQLQNGHVFVGPAIVFQYDTTCVVPPGWHIRVDAWGNLVGTSPADLG